MQHRTITRLVLLCVLPVLGANALYLALVGMQEHLGSSDGQDRALLILRCVSGAEVLLTFIITYFTWSISQRHNIERQLPDLAAVSKSFDVSGRGAINGSAASHVGPLPVRGATSHTPFYPRGKQGAVHDSVLEESTFVHSPRKGAGFGVGEHTAIDMTLGSVGDVGGARSLPGPSSLGMVRDFPLLAAAQGRHARRGTGGSGVGGDYLRRVSGAAGPADDDVDLPSSLNEAHELIMQLLESNKTAWQAVRLLHDELSTALAAGDQQREDMLQQKLAQLTDAQQQCSSLQQQVQSLQDEVSSSRTAAEQARAAAAEAASRSQREAARAQKLAMQVEVEQAANLELQRMLESMGGGATEVSMSDLSDVEGGVSGMEGALIGSFPHRAAASMLNKHRRASSKSRTVSGSSVGSY